jgi:hypothetical protein
MTDLGSDTDLDGDFSDLSTDPHLVTPGSASTDVDNTVHWGRGHEPLIAHAGPVGAMSVWGGRCRH